MALPGLTNPEFVVRATEVRRTVQGYMLLTRSNQVLTLSAPNAPTTTAVAASLAIAYTWPTPAPNNLQPHVALQPIIAHKHRGVLHRVLGRKHYELTDHLGNVRVVVSDVKLSSLSVNNEPHTFLAEVVSRTDYYAFGSLLPGRNYSGSNGYRFGFDTQEKVDEMHGAVGTHYTAQFWEYDPRTARRWNLDPIDQISISNYAAFGLNPILNVDPNGAWFFESKNIRQGRQFARATGGDFSKRNGNAHVDVSGLDGNTTGGAVSFRFMKGQDRGDLLSSVGVDFRDRMAATTSGWDSFKWSAKSLDYATQPGHTPPAAIQALIGLNPIVAAGNVYSGLAEGKDVYGEEQSGLSTGLNALGALPFVGLLDDAGRAIAASRFAPIPKNQAAKIFMKHGDDWGLSGSWNAGRAGEVSSVVNRHINAETVMQISGTYRGQAVTHFLDSKSGLNVILNSSGDFAGGWKLGAGQMESVLSTGRLY